MLDTQTISSLGLDGHSEGLGPPPANFTNVNGRRSEFVIPRTGMVLKFKRMKEIWDEKKKDYVTLEDTQSNDTAKDEENSDADYAFTLVREYRPTETPFIYTTAATIHIRSPYFLQAAQIIMKGHRNVAWNAIPVKFPVETILSLLPKFREYRDNIITQARTSGQAVSEELRHVQEHLDYAIEFLNLEYHSLLQELSSLLKEKRITWPLLWGIYATGTLLLSSCELTREPKLLRLSHTEVKKDIESGDRWLELNCEYVEYAPEGVPGFAATEVRVPEFEGAMSITDLPGFPMSYLDHDRAEEIRQQLLERGQKYHKFSIAPFHATYSGVAYRMYRDDKYKSTAINSRIMIDRDMFNVYCPTHSAPDTRLDLNGRAHPNHRSLHEGRVTRKLPSNEEFMLMPARIYGFSLADRMWLEFNIVYANEISWQEDIFEKLEFPTSSAGAKKVMRSLISCHSSKTAVFDDLISGKGVGLVINLHGPPGVGKTLTAEATSEVALSPLYTVGGGDLGSDPETVDMNLNRIFSLGRAWKAVVLIDEADVFLQQRTDSAQDQRRNAMVSIFLKQLEYYPGILILTTNRLNVFDEAVKSRIHVSINYTELTREARDRLWRTFLAKAGVDVSIEKPEHMRSLSVYEFNGREIKNIVKTATTYATSEDRALTLDDIAYVIEINRSSTLSRGSKRSSGISSYGSFLFARLPYFVMFALPVIVTTALVLPRFKR